MAISSSRASEPFAPFVGRALEAVAAENAPAYHELCALLARGMQLQVDGEELALRFDGRRIEVAALAEPFSPTVRTSWKGLLDLARGDQRIEEALRRESLHAQGKLHDLLSLFDAMQVFVHAAARSSSLARLYLEFEDACARRGIG